jgi:membrane protein insertase Oxa1/YidC/SpoIIIJ
MTYFLPALIVVFSASLPSAVALYWGVSTVFAIGQQKLLQKKTQ